MAFSALGQQDKRPGVCRDSCGGDDQLSNEVSPPCAAALGYSSCFGGDSAGGSGCPLRLGWLRLGLKASHPFPRPLISYIRKFYYYDPQEEVYLSLKEAQLISRQKQDTEAST